VTSRHGDRVSGDGGSGGGSLGAGASDPAAAGPGRAGGLSYAAAGVDIEAGDRAVDLMRSSVASTARPEVMGGIGGFAGLFDAARLAAYRHPVLATSTDGVGTKVVIASRLGIYDTIGIDLVAMVADDLAACGAEPLFMTDYVVCGAIRPQRVAAIVSGVARGCAQAGCALLGGETAEHPGHFGPDDFDLAGAATGAVEADAILGASRVHPGDAVIAMASSGLHSNGYSLVREILRRAQLDLEQEPAELGRPLGRSCWFRPGSMRATAWPSPSAATCTLTPTSQAAAWPATWRASCRPGRTRCWTGARGSRPPSSGSWPGPAWCRPPRWSVCSTWGSA
jgi:hypothetical protein